MTKQSNELETLMAENHKLRQVLKLANFYLHPPKDVDDPELQERQDKMWDEFAVMYHSAVGHSYK